MAVNKLCTNCGYIGPSKRVTKGNLLTELVLWLLMLLPGVLYTVWRITSRYDACPKCGAPNMIPAGSPIAQNFLRDNPKLTPQVFQGSRTEGSGVGFFLLAALLVVGVGGYFLLSGQQRNRSLTTSTPRVALAAPPINTARFATSDDAQREAVHRYPELGINGSKFNTAFRARYNSYKQSRPDYFRDVSWPLRLAEEINEASNPK